MKEIIIGTSTIIIAIGGVFWAYWKFKKDMKASREYWANEKKRFEERVEFMAEKAHSDLIWMKRVYGDELINFVLQQSNMNRNDLEHYYWLSMKQLLNDDENGKETEKTGL